MSDLLDFTQQLITIPSTADKPEELVKVLDAADQQLAGFSKKEFTSKDKPSRLYSNQPDATHFRVILNAHLDVVPGKPEQYSPIVKDGKLWGRGACDMKSGAAAEILAFKQVASQIKYPLGLQLVTDEEIGGYNCSKYQIDQGITADFVIAGEATDLKLNNLAKGIMWVKITAPGDPAHAAYLWNGTNAIWNMKALLDKIQKEFPVPVKEEWVTTANLAKIETPNITFNKVPDVCTISLDIRYVPEEAQTIENRLRQLVPEGFTVEIKEKEPSQKTDQTNPYLVKLAETITSQTNSPAQFIAKHGASDIRHYDRANIPGVCFGPVGDGLHSDQEWCDVGKLQTYYDILVKYLLSL